MNMPFQSHFECILALPFWVFLLGFLLVLILSVKMYRRTLPPVSAGWRGVLAALRSVALFLILMLLVQPVFRFSYQTHKRPSVIALVDTSASMQAVDPGGARGKILERLIRSEPFREFEKSFALSYLLFAGANRSIRGIPKSLAYEGTTTDIAGALESALLERPDAVLLFSDGIYTAGKNPLYAVVQGGIPVYSVAIGSTVEKSDVLIARLQTNEVVYSGVRTPIRIVLRGPGFGGKTADVTLQSEGMVMGRTRTPIPGDGMEGSVEFSYQFQTPGFQKLTVAVKPLAGEATLGNNVQECYVRVMKSKMKILLLADAPSPDLAFFKRILVSDSNVQVTVRTPKAGADFFEGSFPEERDLDGMDQFWMLDTPGRFMPEAVWQKVSSAILKGTKPFLLVAGRNLDVKRLETIGGELPFRIGESRTERSVLPVLTPEGRIHPLLRIENLTDIGGLALPPVFSPWAQVRVVPAGRVLMEAVPEKPDAQGELKQPMIVIRNLGKRKSMAILARGLFRWELMVQGTKQNVDVLRAWIGNAVRWLGIRDDDKPVRLSVNRSVVRAGEENAFSVQVYDESVQPVEGADVRIRFAIPSDQQDVRLSDQGNGQYQAVFRPLKAGKFQAVAEAALDGRILGRDTTDFSVSPFNPEFLDTRARPELLDLLAQKSGGKSGPPDSLAAILKSVRIQEKTVVRKTEWEFSFRPFMLGLILALLSAEWFIRRRKGMA